MSPNAHINIVVPVLKAVADLCHCTSASTRCSDNRMHKQQDSTQDKTFKRQILPLIFIAKNSSTHLTSSILAVTLILPLPSCNSGHLP